MKHTIIATLLVAAVAACSSSTSDATTAAMDDMWSSRDAAEQAGFCAEVRLDGIDETIATFMGAEPDFDIVAVRDWLTEQCDL